MYVYLRTCETKYPVCGSIFLNEYYIYTLCVCQILFTGKERIKKIYLKWKNVYDGEFEYERADFFCLFLLRVSINGCIFKIIHK